MKLGKQGTGKQLPRLAAALLALLLMSAACKKPVSPSVSGGDVKSSASGENRSSGGASSGGASSSAPVPASSARAASSGGASSAPSGGVSSVSQKPLTAANFHGEAEAVLYSLVSTGAGEHALARLRAFTTALGGARLSGDGRAYYAAVGTAFSALHGLARGESSGEQAVKSLQNAEAARQSAGAAAGAPDLPVTGTHTANLWPMAVSACLERGRMKSDIFTITATGDASMGPLNDTPPAIDFNAVMRKNAANPLFPFHYIQPWFQTDDVTLLNLEGPLTNETKRYPKQWTFRGRPEYARVLKNTGVDIAVLANNHTMDYYQAGYDETVKSLNGAGVPYIHEEMKHHSVTKNGVKITFIAYDVRGTQDKPAIFKKVFALIDRVKAQEKPGLLVLELHWGLEYSRVPLDYQKRYSRELIDRGVDLLIGNHAHVFQGIERYKGKDIVYNLGNFCLGNTVLNPRDSIVYRKRYRVSGGKITDAGFEIIPIYVSTSGTVNNFEPNPRYGTQADAIIADLLKYSRDIARDGVTKTPYFRIETGKIT